MSPTDEGATLMARYPLKKEKIIKKSIPLLIALALVGLPALSILGMISQLLALAVFIGLICLAVLVVYYQLSYYKNYFYDLTGDGLVIGKGVISTWRITVPNHKVQDVYLDQDLLDRVFGLYDLHLSTATGVSSREAHIDGVSRESAEKMRAILLDWVSGTQGVMAQNQKVQVSEEALKTFRPERSALLLRVAFSTFFTSLVFAVIFFPLVLLFPFIAIFMYFDYSAMRYELRRNGVFIRTSFFFPKESIYLYRNIQDVQSLQTMLDRIIGVHTLTVKTMTDVSAANANLMFIRSSDAPAIREEILSMVRKAGEAPSQANIQVGTPIPSSGAMRIPAPSKIAPQMDLIAMPFQNHFMKSAIYGLLINGAFVVLGCFFISLLTGAVFGMSGISSLLILLFMLVLLGLGVALLACIRAYIAQISYYYEISKDYVKTRIKFISVSERQIPFSKVQDMEKLVSFSDSFCGLADIKLETGSKEYAAKAGAVSMSTENESVRSLANSDANALKEMLARQMLVSLKGLGVDSLVSRIPLSKKKPLKKTTGWAIYLFALLFILIAVRILFSFSALDLVILSEIAISILALGAKYLYELEYYKRYHYDMNNDVLVIKKGVFGYREITVPLTKIQDVFVDRDILDLVFDLYDVYISTATSRSIMNAHIDGLDEKGAEETALLIARKISEKK